LCVESLEERAVPATTRFAVIGDYGLAGQPESDVANLVAGWNPDLILTTGDNNYQAGSASTIDANIGQYYHAFIAPYQGTYGAGAASNRFFPSLGHADWGYTYPNPTGDQPYLNYFTLPGNERYYTFTVGPVQFFALDSDGNEPDGITSTSPQAQWLQAQLAASTATYKIVYLHDPPYSSSSGFVSTQARWPYQAWGATAVLAGHSHSYERLLENNFPYFVDGLGGEPEISSFDVIDPGSQVRYNADFGAMLVTADAGQIQFQFVTRTGALIDSYTISAGLHLGINVQPATATAGNAVNVTVTALDSTGNIAPGYTGTVQFSSSDSQAILPANYTFTASDGGVHTFSATLGTAGSQSLTATDTATSSITGTHAITVQPATASSLRVTGFPSPITAGTAGTFTVTVLDAYGNIVKGYTGTIRFSSSDSNAVLPANYTFHASDGGVHTFSATLKTAGSQSLTATDSATTTITGAQTVTVRAAAASSLRVTGFPSPITAGTAGTVTVTLVDAYGNVATGYTGTIRFTSSDSKAVLPANYTFTASDAGVHTFSVTLKTAGSQSLTVKDTANTSLTGTQTTTVQAAAASILRVTGFPSSIKAGTSGTFTVTVLDAYGNIATGYTGTIRFSSSDSNAVLPANYTFTASDAGVHTFRATLKTVGTQSLTATDVLNTLITGSQTGITVKH
jgi:hypothetical protein